jgi:putative ABC transport system permease protein
LKNGWIVDFFPLNRPVDSSSVSALFLLQGAVTFVLLIACANVANLLLARGAARQREVATRVALGAGRFRLVRQFFTEGLLLAMLGGGLGLLLAVWGLNFFVRFLPRGIPVLFYVYEGIALDIRVLGFTVMSAFLAAIVFGLAPALRASKPDLQEMLKEGARGSTESLGLRRGRSLLVVMGIATALVLLIGAGLMVKSFLQLNGPFADLEPQNVLSMSITLDANKYRSWHRVRSFWGELQQRIAVLGQSMGFNANQRTNKPWLSWVGVAVEGGAPLNSAVRGAQCDVITPDYLKTMRIPLRRGRYFSEDDARGALPVAIINERFARHFFPTNRDPIGKQIRIINVAEEDEEIDKTTIANAKDIGYFIVGVVRDLRRTGETEGDTPPIMYIPYSLTPEAFTAAMRRITIRLRAQSAPLSLTGAVRNAVSSIDADQPVSPPITLEQADSRFLAPERFLTLLFGTFAFVAMGLASVGIYGVMAYLVTRRTHEIAIRMALGARRGDVLWLVLRHGLKLTLAGIALGLVGAFSLKRILSSYIFGVSSTDPVTFAIVSVVLISVALLATYVPARKATKVDPMAALRSE